MKVSLKDGATARKAIVEIDVETARRHWQSLFPHLPIGTDAQIRAMLHAARTKVGGIPVKLRVYSHDWLTAQGLPSFLPERFKPKREQREPTIATGVGIAVNFRNEILKPIGPIVEKAMGDAVLEAQADGKLLDAAFVRTRMFEAKNYTIEKLLGIKRGA